MLTIFFLSLYLVLFFLKQFIKHCELFPRCFIKSSVLLVITMGGLGRGAALVFRQQGEG